MKDFLNTENIPGVEELKIDVNKNKPGTQLIIDRKKAGELGVSSGMIASQLRNSCLVPKQVFTKKMAKTMKLTSVFKTSTVMTSMPCSTNS